MVVYVFLAIAAVGPVGIAFWTLFRRLKAAPDINDALQGRIQQELDRTYQPALRVFNPADFEFLRAQPGYEPQLESQLLAGRRAAYRGYLRAMDRDFSLLYNAARVIAAHHEQASGLMWELFWLRVRFRWNLRLSQTGLCLQVLRLPVSSGDIVSLGEMVEKLRLRLAAVPLRPSAV